MHDAALPILCYNHPMFEMKPLDTNEFKRDALRLHLLSDVALPEAVRYTLNELAVKTWKGARKGLDKHFTLRNTWTKRSIAFQKAGPGGNIDQMASYAGTREAYMREQEEGVNRTSQGKYGEPIPTTHVSGEGGSRLRKKKIMRKFYLSRLRVARGLYDTTKGQAQSEAQHLPILIATARKMRKRVFFWRSRSGKAGLFLLEKKGLPMLYDLSRRRITSRSRPWLSGPTKVISPMLFKLYGKALRFQLYKLSK